MMQIPSSNQSHSSRRSTSSSTASIAAWFDGLLDKACCAPGYSAGEDMIDDNSIAYTASNDENYNHLFQAADEYIPWLSPSHIAQQEDFPIPQRSSKRTSRRSLRISEEAPLSPGSNSVATETTAMTCSTTSSRTTTPLGNGGQNTNHHHHNRHHTKHKSNKSRHYAPKMSELSKIEKHTRSHSTGNMKSPEDEWAQHQHEEEHEKRRMKKLVPVLRPEEVEIPSDWQHDAGFRRIWSDSLPKLPFQTVQLSHGHS